MNFERHQHPLIALGLGKFEKLDEDIKKYFNESLSSLKPIYKSVRGSSEGNCHKFLLYIPDGSEVDKKLVESSMWRIEWIYRNHGFSKICINYYRRQKFFRKYEFPGPGLLVEIKYFEVKEGKKLNKNVEPERTWNNLL